MSKTEVTEEMVLAAREELARLVDPQAFDGSTESKHGKGVASQEVRK